jgi:transcriptional regulator with XRE-family HTH domain
MGRPLKELGPTRCGAPGLGAELRHWRVLRGLSQQRLGGLVHFSGALVGKIEKAERAASLAFCERADVVLETGGVLSRMLRVPVERDRLEAADGSDDLAAESLRWVDDVAAAVRLSCRMWGAEVDRRAELASAALAAGAFATPLASWSRGEPDGLPTGGARRVGQGEVDALWAMCGSLADADHRLGGGYARSTLMHYLDAVVRPLLLDAVFDEQVGRGLLGAAARLCDLCAFMSFDSAEQGLAQRYFVQALRLARASGDQALGGHILGDMSMQVHHLGDASRALELAEAGYRAGRAAGSPSTAARCAVLAGRAHALRGDHAAAARSRLLAEQRLDATAAGPEPRWIRFFTPAQLAVESQYIASDLGDHREVRRIAETLGTPAREMQRRRVLSAATLADAHLHPADTDVERACAVLTDVLPAMPALTSVRARDRVAGVRRKLAQHASRPSVREFEQRHEQLALVAGPA